MKDSRYEEAEEAESGDTLPGKVSVWAVLSIFLFIPILDKLPDMFEQPAHLTSSGWVRQSCNY